MSREDIDKLIEAAYRWGRDNGSKRSDKNLNDFKETKIYKKLMLKQI